MSEKKQEKGKKSENIEKRNAAAKRRSGKRTAMMWNIVMLVAVVVLAVSLWQLSGIILGYHKANSIYDDIASHMEQDTVPVPVPEKESKPETSTPEKSESAGETEAGKATEATEAAFVLTVPDFTYLQGINSDVIGWIQIPGTKINYPIVQGSDNEYYLTHTFSGEENSSGAIFMDAEIRDGFDDKNPIIHGHNLKSGAMFSRLNRYSRKSFWDANRYIYITTPDGLAIYQVFSAYTADPDADIYWYGFGSNEEFQEYLDRILSYSIFDAGISVTKEDRIVTLSTCTNDTTQRFVVHAKRIQ